MPRRNRTRKKDLNFSDKELKRLRKIYVVNNEECRSNSKSSNKEEKKKDV